MTDRIRHSILFIFTLVMTVAARAQDTSIIFPPGLGQLPDTALYDESNAGESSFDFNEKPQQVQVDTRTVPAAEVRAKKLDDDYWYADKAPNKKAKQQERANGERGQRRAHDPVLFNTPWWRVLFWVLLIGFVGLLIWFLVTNNISLFRRTAAAQPQEAGGEIMEDIFAMNFEKEIASAIQQGNYRLAVRLLYLRTLRDLSNRNLISYTHEKTNSDYLMQLAGTSYYRNFFTLTRNFDYTWYGQFELSPQNFEIVQREFSSFKQQLS